MNIKVLLKNSVVPGLAILLLIYLLLGNREDVAFLTREDGVVESLTALFYLFGLLVCIRILYKGRWQLLPVVWAILCFVFLGEETSWFQRLLGYSVPAVENINFQHEFNIHNLNIFHGRSADFVTQKTGYKLLNAQNLFRAGLLFYFCLLPLLTCSHKLRKLLRDKVGYQRPSAIFLTQFLSIVFLSFLLAIGVDMGVRNDLAETREMIYAYAILAYIYLYLAPNTHDGEVHLATPALHNK
jgi:hypothetical protein